jgi:D-beta-D-heptose 7-phosphate kinase/D-beta-D-heptose 1-phosphate adenosyltransferase
MLTDKIKSWDEIRSISSDLKSKCQTIVFTNGCFDILHCGHVLYLEQAKACGDVLVLGLNSDASVQRLKGKDRPINKQDDRAIVLAGLQAVDFVVIFDEDTPYNLIANIMPDVLVKGGDWSIADIVGSDIVLASGGIVKSLGFTDGKSTTNIITNIVNNTKGY